MTEPAPIFNGKALRPKKPRAPAKPKPEAMTIRDQFAVQAVAALLSVRGPSDMWAAGHPGEYARRAYQVADAMLEARSKAP